MLNSRKKSLVIVALSACSVALLSLLVSLERGLRFDAWPDLTPPGSSDVRIGDRLLPDPTTEDGATGRPAGGVPDFVTVSVEGPRPAVADRPSSNVQDVAAILVGLLLREQRRGGSMDSGPAPGPGRPDPGEIEGPPHTVADFGPEPAEGEVFPPSPDRADVPTAVRPPEFATVDEDRRGRRRDGESRRPRPRRRRGRRGGADGEPTRSTLATRGAERSQPSSPRGQSAPAARPGSSRGRRRPARSGGRAPTAGPAALRRDPAPRRLQSPATRTPRAPAHQPPERVPQKAPSAPLRSAGSPSQGSHGGPPNGRQPGGSHGRGDYGGSHGAGSRGTHPRG